MSVQFDPTLYLKRKVALREWMEAVLGERIDTTQDLAVVLQSGVHICRVMLAVCEGSIPKIHTNTTLQFKMRENIMFFLHACEDISIPRYKIFAIPDLLEGKNFFKVLECMEELALIAEQDKPSLPILKPVVNGIFNKSYTSPIPHNTCMQHHISSIARIHAFIAIFLATITY
jgi:hypothetical protein